MLPEGIEQVETGEENFGWVKDCRVCFGGVKDKELNINGSEADDITFGFLV